MMKVDPEYGPVNQPKEYKRMGIIGVSCKRKVECCVFPEIVD